MSEILALGKKIRMQYRAAGPIADSLPAPYCRQHSAEAPEFLFVRNIADVPELPFFRLETK